MAIKAGSEIYRGDAYEAPRIAYQLLYLSHFGGSRDFSALVDSSQREEYVKGVLTSGFVFWACFVVWAIGLIVCKRMGKDRVGFLSGEFRDPPNKGAKPFDDKLVCANSQEGGWKVEGNEDSQTASDFSAACNDASPLVHLELMDKCTVESGATSTSQVGLCHCLLFIGSGAIFLACLAVLFTQGVLHAHDTIELIASSGSKVQYIAHESYTLVIETVPEMKSLVSSLRQGIQLELGLPEFCPMDPALDDTWLASEIRVYAHDIIDQLNTLDDFLSFDVKGTAKVLELIEKEADKVNDLAESIDITRFATALLFVLLALIPVLIMAAALMGYEQVPFPSLDCLVRWLFIPSFIMIVVAAWTLLGVSLLSATMTVDFCLPSGAKITSSPDQTILRMLQVMNQPPSGLTFQFAEHIMSGCEVDADIVDMLEKYRFKMIDASYQLAGILKGLKEGHTLPDLQSHCGRDMSPVQTLLDDTTLLLDTAHDAISKILYLLSCDFLVLLYQEAVHEGVCTHGISALYWILVAFTGMAFTGSAMITLRAVCKQ